MRRDELCEPIRRRLTRLPEPYNSHYGVVPPPPPEDTIDLGPGWSRYEAALAALGRLKQLSQGLQDQYLISRMLTRREAVSSSSIEGTYSTLDELLSIEETEDDQATTAAKQVRSYALTLDTLVPEAGNRGPTYFTEDLIRRLHRAVMADDSAYRGTPGEFRDHVVWIGGGGDIAYSIYNPPPPDQVRPCLLDTVDYLQCQGMQAMTQGLIIRMAVSHAHFESVHPFADGNGRTGRLLLPLMMAADQQVPLYLSPYIEANKVPYYAALKAAQQRLEWPAIIGFIADAVVNTVDELATSKSALAALTKLWRWRRPFRAGSASVRALAILPYYPVVTVARLAKLLAISFPAASHAVHQLVEAGILTERTGHARNRLFAAPEALSIVNRPFGEQPVLPSR